MKIVSTRFANIHSTENGGVLTFKQSTDLCIVGCIFEDTSTDNTIGYSGGAIYIHSGSMNVYHSCFLRCRYLNGTNNFGGNAIETRSSNYSSELSCVMLCSDGVGSENLIGDAPIHGSASAVIEFLYDNYTSNYLNLVGGNLIIESSFNQKFSISYCHFEGGRSHRLFYMFSNSNFDFQLDHSNFINTDVIYFSDGTPNCTKVYNCNIFLLEVLNVNKEIIFFECRSNQKSINSSTSTLETIILPVREIKDCQFFSILRSNSKIKCARVLSMLMFIWLSPILDDFE